MPIISAKVFIDFGELLVVLYGKSVDTAHVDVVGFAIGAASKMLALADSNTIILGQSAYQGMSLDMAKDFTPVDVDVELRWPYIVGSTKTKYLLYSSKTQV